MRKNIIIMIFAIVCAFCCALGLTACADMKSSNRANLSYTETDDGYAFTGVNKQYKGKVVIPAEVNGKPVVSISERAFYYCTNVTEIEIPDTVTSIGSHAFSRCSSLKSIKIPEGVTSIDTGTFYDCQSLTHIELPSTITSIGTYAVLSCPNITSATLPTTAIKDFLSESRLTLKTVVINGGESIPYGAFSVCVNLTSVTIPDSITSIEDGAFSGCSALPSIDIPNSVTSIGRGAFSNCDSLTSITIPSSVTFIGSRAFGRCTGLTSITVQSGNPVYFSAGNCIIEKETKTLISGCKTSVIPADNSVEIIGYAAFMECIGLTSITIPDSVTKIDHSAFSGCSDLTSVTIPDGVTDIDSLAFEYSGLTSLTILGSATNIDGTAFRFCADLTSITVQSGNTKYASAGNCLIDTETKTLVLGCKTSVIPTDNSVESIGESAFCGCGGLTSIVLPDSVTKIENAAFSSCSGLTSVTIPAGVTSIGNTAFSNCENLITITYNGTKDDWGKIKKIGWWNSYSGEYVVNCTDGTLTKSESW